MNEHALRRPLPEILIVGDSLTQIPGYAEVFEKELAGCYSVRHYGHGGSSALGVAAMQGGVPVYCKPLTVPAEPCKIEIHLFTDSISSELSIGGQSLEGLNPCALGGIEGTFTCEYPKMFFQRSEAGEAVPFIRPVPLVFACHGETGKTLVIWVGTNDSYRQTDAKELSEHLEDIIDSMIRHNGSDSYIVMGLTSWYYCPVVDKVNRLLARHYGEHFLDVRTYILQYGLDDAGIEPTEADRRDLENGEIPGSLRVDVVHFTYEGFSVIGKLLYKRGRELGYWE